MRIEQNRYKWAIARKKIYGIISKINKTHEQNKQNEKKRENVIKELLGLLAANRRKPVNKINGK